MKRAAITLCLCLSVFASACSGDHGVPGPPTGPTVTPAPTPSPTPRPPGQIPGYDQTWRLTTQLTEVIDPKCGQGVGSATGLMAAARSGSNVKFLYWVGNYPTDDVDYAGIAEGDDFTAQSVAFPTTLCGPAATFQGTLVGRFSNDGRHLEARETWSYHLASGDEQLIFNWTADRQ